MTTSLGRRSTGGAAATAATSALTALLAAPLFAGPVLSARGSATYDVPSRAAQVGRGPTPFPVTGLATGARPLVGGEEGRRAVAAARKITESMKLHAH